MEAFSRPSNGLCLSFLRDAGASEDVAGDNRLSIAPALLQALHRRTRRADGHLLTRTPTLRCCHPSKESLGPEEPSPVEVRPDLRHVLWFAYHPRSRRSPDRGGDGDRDPTPGFQNPSPSSSSFIVDLLHRGLSWEGQTPPAWDRQKQGYRCLSRGDTRSGNLCHTGSSRDVLDVQEDHPSLRPPPDPVGPTGHTSVV